MKCIAHHLMLASGETQAGCRKQVEDYFARTELVRYEKVIIDDKATLSGSHSEFSRTLDDAIARNRRVLAGLIKDLEAIGVRSVSDLVHLEQGYPSKVLHIAAHLLDGFIGTDSVFYNLVDDSHWLPEQTRHAILASPDNYWLIPVDGFSLYPEKAGLIRL